MRNNLQKFFRVYGLQKEIIGPGLERSDGCMNVGIAGDKDNGNP